MIKHELLFVMMMMIFEQYEEMKYDTDREQHNKLLNRNARRITGFVGGEEHWGHIECHCPARKNQTVKERSRSGIIHSDQCLWTCCKSKWDQQMCSDYEDSDLSD